MVLEVEAVRGSREADVDGWPGDAARDGQVAVMATCEAVEENSVHVGHAEVEMELEKLAMCAGRVSPGPSSNRTGGDGGSRRLGFFMAACFLPSSHSDLSVDADHLGQDGDDAWSDCSG
ncbi:hypothetical protein P7K49_029811 [Saguinus oedipus]|uniref:Uncharacterized protein n=1 Tax=Saguinus oedipus TaxID=9490 RepID=A0ABQ9U894_SAGOE|nr:hypothetical protein P7K49_029811 [Saguinus oedipus]